MPAAIAIPAIIGAATAGASVYSARSGNKASTAAARLQTQQANYAADLEAKAAAEALEFTKAQEATRRAEFNQAQARNYDLYQRAEARDEARYAQDQANKKPFREFSLGAMGQMGQPIYKPGQRRPGTLGSLY